MGPHDLMDQADVAEMLGVTIDTVRTSRSAGRARYADMPPPLREVSGRPVWLRRDIEAWAAGRVHELWTWPERGPAELVREATADEFREATENGRRGGLPGTLLVGGELCVVHTRPGVVFRTLDEVRRNVADGAEVEVRQGAKVVARGLYVGGGAGYVEVRRRVEDPSRLVDWAPGTTLMLVRQGQPCDV